MVIWRYFSSLAMDLRPLAAFLALGLLLGACAGAQPTRYQPAGSGGYGYSEEELIAPAFKLTFAGNSLTDRRTVEDYHLYRAAERSAELGYAHFGLKDKLVEKVVREYYDPYWGGRSGYGYGSRHRYGSGASVSIGFPLGGSPGYRREVFAASAIVIPFDRSPPPDVAGYHDVDQVLKALGPKILRPVQP